MFWFSLTGLLSALSISNPLENDMQIWHCGQDVKAEPAWIRREAPVRAEPNLPTFSDQSGETRFESSFGPGNVGSR